MALELGEPFALDRHDFRRCVGDEARICEARAAAIPIGERPGTAFLEGRRRRQGGDQRENGASTARPSTIAIKRWAAVPLRCVRFERLEIAETARSSGSERDQRVRIVRRARSAPRPASRRRAGSSSPRIWRMPSTIACSASIWRTASSFRRERRCLRVGREHDRVGRSPASGATPAPDLLGHEGHQRMEHPERGSSTVRSVAAVAKHACRRGGVGLQCWFRELEWYQSQNSYQTNWCMPVPRGRSGRRRSAPGRDERSCESVGIHDPRWAASYGTGQLRSVRLRFISTKRAAFHSFCRSATSPRSGPGRTRTDVPNPWSRAPRT